MPKTETTPNLGRETEVIATKDGVFLLNNPRTARDKVRQLVENSTDKTVTFRMTPSVLAEAISRTPIPIDEPGLKEIDVEDVFVDIDNDPKKGEKQLLIDGNYKGANFKVTLKNGISGLEFVTCKVPFLLRVFKGRIEKKLKNIDHFAKDAINGDINHNQVDGYQIGAVQELRIGDGFVECKVERFSDAQQKAA